jgi:hypothetical protein
MNTCCHVVCSLWQVCPCPHGVCTIIKSFSRTNICAGRRGIKALALVPILHVKCQRIRKRKVKISIIRIRPGHCHQYRLLWPPQPTFQFNLPRLSLCPDKPHRLQVQLGCVPTSLQTQRALRASHIGNGDVNIYTLLSSHRPCPFGKASSHLLVKLLWYFFGLRKPFFSQTLLQRPPLSILSSPSVSF